MSQIDGIFFDLGGTLFSYGAQQGRRGGNPAIKHLIDSLQIEAEGEAIGKAWQQANAKVMARLNSQPYFLHKSLFLETVEEFARTFSRSADDALLETFHAMQRDAVVNHMPIREECLDTLRALKEHGLYLSIVSNIDDDYLFPLVERHGLDEVLDHWTSSEEAQSCKPDPDIFHYSLNKSGLEREKVLFVGDSLHHDIAGADAAGLRSARIVEEGVTTPLTDGLTAHAQPNFEITSLTDLLDLVRDHNRRER